MDDLKAKAAPKYERLAKEANDQNAKLDICITLLARLCELKEDQREGEDDRHDLWLVREDKESEKRAWDMRSALCVLGVAVAGVSLDFIKVDSEGRFLTWLINLFS